jgi:carbon storage regulator
MARKDFFKEGVKMLVLTRKTGEEIVIGDDIRVKVVAVQGDRVRIGIDAPRSVPVDRYEVHLRRAEFQDAEPVLQNF